MAGTRSAIGEEMDRQHPVDIALTSADPLSDAMAETVTSRPGVAEVGAIAGVQVMVSEIVDGAATALPWGQLSAVRCRHWPACSPACWRHDGRRGSPPPRAPLSTEAPASAGRRCGWIVSPRASIATNSSIRRTRTDSVLIAVSR